MVFTLKFCMKIWFSKSFSLIIFFITDEHSRALIKVAMRRWERQTCIRFVPLSEHAQSESYIKFYKSKTWVFVSSVLGFILILKTNYYETEQQSRTIYFFFCNIINYIISTCIRIKYFLWNMIMIPYNWCL